ncbi:MAG TPA: glycosyltransferase family 2 protein [Rickettsiales bacterium]|nr:glycosyltransferase family 2 protein [Rickettsiales bacterium]
MDNHTVCIVIAAYNAQATIARAIRSALAEPEVTEVVVVDDASSDGTVEAALMCDDGTRRLKVLVQPVNRGPSAARNVAIANSTSAWIGILDADDFLLPGRTAGLLAYGENADMIADDLWQVPETAVEGPRKSLLGDALEGPRLVGFQEFVLSNVTGRGSDRKELGFIKPLMRREFLAEHGIRYQEHMRLGEDFELYARSLALGARLVLVPPQGYVSVVRPNSLSGTHSETDLQILRDCGVQLLSELGISREDREALRRHARSVDCRLQWRLLIRAVKERNTQAALAAFRRPHPVPAYLIERLVEQLYLRTFGRILALKRAG